MVRLALGVLNRDEIFVLEAPVTQLSAPAVHALGHEICHHVIYDEIEIVPVQLAVVAASQKKPTIPA